MRAAAARDGLASEAGTNSTATGGGTPGSAGSALPDSNAARWMRKALLDEQQLLVDAYERQRRADDDDDAVKAALHVVLDAIAVTYLRDKHHRQEHESKSGLAWRGTEAGVGSMAKEAAQTLWLRMSTAHKIWNDYNYDLERYATERASGLALTDYLAGRATSVPAVDVAAQLTRCVYRKERARPPRTENPAKRSSGAQQNSKAAGSSAQRVPLPPTSMADQNKVIDGLQAKLAQARDKKQKMQKDEAAARSEVAAKAKAASRPARALPSLTQRKR